MGYIPVGKFLLLNRQETWCVGLGILGYALRHWPAHSPGTYTLHRHETICVKQFQYERSGFAGVACHVFPFVVR